MSLELLEQTAVLRTLMLTVERPRYITELRRTSVNPSGVASLETLQVVRHNLGTLGLITEEMERGPRPKTFLTITDKGKRVAQKIREIQEILEE